MKIKAHNHYTRRENPPVGEYNGKPSETVPDQTLTIKEILDKYAKGIPISNAKVPVYDEDENDVTPDLAHMDLVDRENYMEERYGHLKSELEAIQKAAATKAADEEFEKRLAQWKKDNPEKPPPSASGPSGAPLGV